MSIEELLIKRSGDLEMLSNEYRDPAQRGYCFFKPKSVLRKALKNAAESFGCLAYTEDDYWLTIVGEKAAVDNVEEVRRLVLSDEYGYGRTLTGAVQQVDILMDQLEG